MLVDGALHYPTLHTCVGAENAEGLSDAALFGVSVGRVAQPIDGGAFYLISAGTAVADANAVAGSPRWGTLLGGFVEAGVKLLLFLRDGDSGCAAFLGSASDIIVLAEEHERAPASVRDLEGMVRAVAGPAGGAAHAVADSTSAFRPPQEWMAAGPGGRQRLALIGAVAVVVILVLLVAFGVIPVPGLSPEPLGTVSHLPSGSVSVIG
jgi:hypothetical protein